MRALSAVILSSFVLVALVGCSSHVPPTGRWEGAFEAQDLMAVIRLEISPKGEIFLSAPDALDIAPGTDKAELRQRLSQELAASWTSVESRSLDFDGYVFRKPGGIAPQLEWNPETKQMTAVLYLGMRAALRVPLRAVPQFSVSPW